MITAQVALETAQANLIGLGVARAQYAHAIAVLVGKNPEDLDIPKAAPSCRRCPPFRSACRRPLLERRPDIAAAERTMKAQNAAVGVAVAAYYPTISLSAAGGFTQSPLNGLLHSANHVWSLGANGTETLFDFGERHAEVQAARAAYEAAVASYRNTVLTAFEDVENDLSGLRILDAAVEGARHRRAGRGSRHGDRAWRSSRRARSTTPPWPRRRKRQLSDQQSALTVQESRLVDAVSLIGDLGGGWSAGELHTASSPKTLPPDPSVSPHTAPP